MNRSAGANQPSTVVQAWSKPLSIRSTATVQPRGASSSRAPSTQAARTATTSPSGDSTQIWNVSPAQLDTYMLRTARPGAALMTTTPRRAAQASSTGSISAWATRVRLGAGWAGWQLGMARMRP